jgi:hypothetical protein
MVNVCHSCILSGSLLRLCMIIGDAWKMVPTPCPQNCGTIWNLRMHGHWSARAADLRNGLSGTPQSMARNLLHGTKPQIFL